MATILDKPKCLHREQKPIKACVRCGAWLRSFANDAYCDPCSKPSITTLSTEEIFEALHRSGYRDRNKAMDAIGELLEAAP